VDATNESWIATEEEVDGRTISLTYSMVNVKDGADLMMSGSISLPQDRRKMVMSFCMESCFGQKCGWSFALTACKPHWQNQRSTLGLSQICLPCIDDR
jgi:hypothetical protein